MSEALEITTFKLISGLTGDDFINANDDINDYLQRQSGFRWRRIVQDDNGMITDIVAWDDVKDAQRSATGIMSVMANSPVHATIDHTTVEFRIVPVLHHLSRTNANDDMKNRAPQKIR